jgi:hypothetical protein
MADPEREQTNLNDAARAWTVEFEVVHFRELDSEAMARLAQAAARAHRLAGATELIDGQAVFSSDASRSLLQCAKRFGRAGAFVYAWPTPFGPVATLSLAVPGGLARGRICTSARDSVWDALAAAGSASYLLLCKGDAPILLLKTGPAHRGELAALLEKARSAPVRADEPTAAYWLFRHAFFKDDVTPQDRLQRGWARALHNNLKVQVDELRYSRTATLCFLICRKEHLG